MEKRQNTSLLQKVLGKFYKYAVWVLPVIFLMLAVLIHYSRGEFYMLSTDPEYFHLFNGLNLAIFNLAVDYIAHPGTTIQIIYAISAYIVNLTQPENSIIANAMNNPEQFIHGANILINIITALLVFLLGIYTYRFTHNIFLAFLLQLMPFGDFRLLLISGRIAPETALIAPLLLLAILVIKYLYDFNKEKNIRKYLVGFALIGGLGIAGKLSYLPFLIVPLFILPTNKSRFSYLIYTLVAIVVFAFPMFVHLDKSWEWISGMFVHSGKYGHGATNFMEASAIPKRLNILYHMDRSMFIIMGMAFILMIVYYILPYFRKRENTKPVLRIMLAFLMAIVLALILVLKHFEAHYFTPFLLFKFFLLFLIAELILVMIKPAKIKKIISAFVLLITAILIIPQVKQLKSSVSRIEKRAEKFDQRTLLLSRYDVTDNPIIIDSHYRGSPFIQSAMVGGCLMSGPLKSTFTHQLAEKYPNTYFYFTWTDKFYFWDKFRNAKDFVDTNKPLYIFIGQGKESSLPVILDRIKTDFPNKETDLHLLQKFTNPDEYFYKVSFNEKSENSTAKN